MLFGYISEQNKYRSLPCGTDGSVGKDRQQKVNIIEASCANSTAFHGLGMKSKTYWRSSQVKGQQKDAHGPSICYSHEINLFSMLGFAFPLSFYFIIIFKVSKTFHCSIYLEKCHLHLCLLRPFFLPLLGNHFY